MIDKYFQELERLIARYDIVQTSSVTYDKRTDYIGFIRGSLYLLDNSVLHFREYVNVQFGYNRYMYVYHYQQADNSLIFRYDNTPHFPDLPDFPHHKHEQNETNVISTPAPDLKKVLDDIKTLLVFL